MELRGRSKVVGRPVGEDRVMKVKILVVLSLTCQNVPIPETRLLDSNLLFCNEGKPALGLLRNFLLNEGTINTLFVVTTSGRLEKSTALKLIEEGEKFVGNEPNVIDIDAPVTSKSKNSGFLMC